MRGNPGARFLRWSGASGPTAPPKGRLTVEITGILTAIIVGLIIGALGRLVVPGKQDLPIWLTLVIGIVAGLLGTVLAGLLGVDDTPGVDWIELAMQVALAAVGVALTASAHHRRTH